MFYFLIKNLLRPKLSKRTTLLLKILPTRFSEIDYPQLNRIAGSEVIASVLFRVLFDASPRHSVSVISKIQPEEVSNYNCVHLGKIDKFSNFEKAEAVAKAMV